MRSSAVSDLVKIRPTINVALILIKIQNLISQFMARLFQDHSDCTLFFRRYG